MKISEILWKAANEQLWDGSNMRVYGNEFDASRNANKRRFSCDAFNSHYMTEISLCEMRKVKEYLAEFGLDCESMQAFHEFDSGEERQGARYSWLMFASMIAEEEGL